MSDKNNISTDTLFLFSLFSVKDKDFSLENNLKETASYESNNSEKSSRIFEVLSSGNEPWISKKISTKIFNNFSIKSIKPLPMHKTLQSTYYAYYIEFNQQNYGGILLEPSEVKEADDLYSTSSGLIEKYKFFEFVKSNVFNNIDNLYISIPTPTKMINTKKFLKITNSHKAVSADDDFWIDDGNIKSKNKNDAYIESPFFPILFSLNHSNNNGTISKLITGNFDLTIDEEMNKSKDAEFKITSKNTTTPTTYKYFFAPDCDGCAITTTGKSISPSTMLQCLNIFIILTLQRAMISSIKHKCLTQKVSEENIKKSKTLMLEYKERLNSIKEYTETAQYLPSVSGSLAHHLYKKEIYDMSKECNEANEMCNSVLKDIDNFKQNKLDTKLNIIAIMAIVSIVWDGLSLVEHIFHFTI